FHSFALRNPLSSAVSASSILFGSFSKFHGKGEACNSLEYIRMARKSMTRSDIINNCFICMETCRIIKLMCDRFPGTAGIIFLALKTERKNNIHGTTILELISLALSGKPLHAVTNDFFELKSLLYKICGLKSCEETIAEITKFSSDEEGWKKLEHFFQTTPAPLSFFPDFMFNGMVSESPPLSLGLDGRKPPQMKNEGQEKKESKRAEDDNLALSDVYHDKTGYENSQGKKGDDIEMGFLYDEWNQQSDDYFEKWCLTREKKVLSSRELNVSQEHQYLARRVRRFFEALKPDLARKEKYLPDGDDINIDMLMDFISMRKARICPNIKFYEKSRIKKRDICVAILVDMSGSTSDDAGQGGKIIDLEKISAYILGEGLCETGDKFGIFGFSGNGRRNAEFFILKDFDSEWNDESKGAVFNVQPRSSTRIGVALRHAGQKLSKMSSKKKILILITDGKPMDSEYDSGSRYAQFDVRKANEENSKFGIDSFCISTEENSAEDLELMFPVKRFVIIKGMGELPSLLSRFYLRLTK
nr:VWA domain-containing protein [Victivallales bacterium]